MPSFFSYQVEKTTATLILPRVDEFASIKIEGRLRGSCLAPLAWHGLPALLLLEVLPKEFSRAFPSELGVIRAIEPTRVSQEAVIRPLVQEQFDRGFLRLQYLL